MREEQIKFDPSLEEYEDDRILMIENEDSEEDGVLVVKFDCYPSEGAEVYLEYGNRRCMA